MDLFGLLLLSLISILVGVIITLSIQYYIFYIYLKKSPIAERNVLRNYVQYNLPEALKKELDGDLNEKKSNSLPISLVMQFLFHELRHCEPIKKWLYKKLTLEFDELLTKTTIGKFFESINIKDMHLGNEFPDIKDIKVDSVKLNKDEYIETLTLSLDLDYTGNFLLSIDAKMKFGKTAYLSIKVKKISGLARLQFTRVPYTHWSFCFYQEPVMDLAVESHFQGRHLQSNITNLIVHQIKKAIRRKHTLPNYKIRYKPFFVKTDPCQLDLEENEVVPLGQLDLTCVEVSRLSYPSIINNIYCNFAIDFIPWICLYQKEDGSFCTVLEITLNKLRQVQLGVIFKQEQGSVIVDSVTMNSSAYKSGLKAGDTVISIENKPVNSVPQIAKLMKSSSTVTLRVERLAENYTFKLEDSEKPVESDSELTQTEQDTFIIIDKKETEKDLKPKVITRGKMIPSNENMSKLAQTIGNFSLRKRKTSLSDKNDSVKSTPSSSTPATPQHIPPKQQSMTIPPSNIKKNSICELPEIIKNDYDSIEVYRTKELSHCATISFNDDFRFVLRDGLKYLNINVWGTVPNEKDVLLGYSNIPLSHILNECCNSVLGHYMRSYSFLPPTNSVPNTQTHPLLTHSGFEHVFCYGDILLSFVWTHEEDVELKRKTMAEEDLKVEVEESPHDFIRTQFHRTTHCDFCNKKIWLKDAVQCRDCGLCCHKKCVTKCQMSLGCRSSRSDSTEGLLQTEDVDSDSSSIKRVNSANNLSIPGGYNSCGSKSLPQSPQRTPSRKQSIVSVNPFTACPGVLDEIQAAPGQATELINKLLEQIMLCPLEETLMDNAKETGKTLYANLTQEERTEKINFMVGELKKTLDSITLEQMELTKQMGLEESEVERAKLAFLIGQADAKVHGLSVLMLHYCSGLQHTQEKIV